MKDKGLVWEVEYQLKKHFTSEKAARRFYKKTSGRDDLKLVLIRHRLLDNTRRMADRVMASLLKRTRFSQFWNALSDQEQRKIMKSMTKTIREILENIL